MSNVRVFTGVPVSANFASANYNLYTGAQVTNILLSTFLARFFCSYLASA